METPKSGLDNFPLAMTRQRRFLNESGDSQFSDPIEMRAICETPLPKSTETFSEQILRRRYLKSETYLRPIAITTIGFICDRRMVAALLLLDQIRLIASPKTGSVETLDEIIRQSKVLEEFPILEFFNLEAAVKDFSHSPITKGGELHTIASGARKAARGVIEKIASQNLDFALTVLGMLIHERNGDRIWLEACNLSIRTGKYKLLPQDIRNYW